MIQFFIENNEVILSSDFSFTWTEENPEITNDGEFSLDMTISLIPPQNVIAFGFLNRLNKATIPKKVDSRLVIDGQNHSGTFVLSTNDNVAVKGQFLAGNSELKYIAKNEKKIWGLDGWGSEDSIDYIKALFSVEHAGYGEVRNGPVWLGFNNYVCPPVKLGDEIINNYTIQDGNGTASDNGGVDNMFPINGISGKIIMQPYILYYINELPKLLGYTLKYNILNTDDRARRMFIVNSSDSLNYADALPDMSVYEFIDAIQKIFNVSFLVDAKDKSISIESLSSNLKKKKIVDIKNTLTPYTRDQSQDSKSLRFDFSKISYEVGSSNYYKYQKLSDDIINKCEIKEFDNFTTLVNYVMTLGSTYIDKLYIYRDLEFQNDYVYDSRTTTTLYSHYSGPYGSLRLLNKFSSIGDSDSQELILKIRPVEVTKGSARIRWTINDNTTTVYGYFQLPKSSNEYYIKKYTGFIESVENGDSDIPRLSVLEVALYSGEIQLFNENNYGITVKTKYPFSHVDTQPDFSLERGGGYGSPWAAWEAWIKDNFKAVVKTTMCLKGSNGILSDYHQKSILDTSTEYVFTLIDNPDVRANNIFNIDNLKYFPISIEREKKQTKTTAKGTFYRML